MYLLQDVTVFQLTISDYILSYKHDFRSTIFTGTTFTCFSVGEFKNIESILGSIRYMVVVFTSLSFVGVDK